MPGLCGLLTTMPRADAEATLASMVGALTHEAFYTTGMYVDEQSGLYVGWAERQARGRDRMPLRSGSGEVALVLSGEMIPETDAASLADQAEADRRFPAALNGRFHGVRIDRRAGTVTLFNDRYGMHRLYYHDGGDAFYFSAEAKAILAVRPQLRLVDPRGLAELISCGCVLENRTLFPGVHVLPGGAAWTFRRAVIESAAQYFTPREWEEQPALDAGAYYEELRGAFTRVLPGYFESRERVGMSLTGGLDTRMVMAWQRCAPGSLPCYTFGGTFRECADVRVARRVAAICGQPHETIAVGAEFLRRFSTYAERTIDLTDGCADVSRSPDLYVNQLARDIAPVRMTGNYGGEVLRRVVAFKHVEPRAGVFQPALAEHVQRARETYRALLTCHPVSFAVFRQAPWHHYGLLALEQTQVAMRSPFLDNEIVRTAFRAPAPAQGGHDVCLRLIEEGHSTLRHVATDRGPIDGGPWSAARRAAIEFMRLSEYAYDYGMPRWLVPIDRRLSILRPERLFLGRQKFFHFRLWYRGTLAGYVREMLLDPRSLSRPYVHRPQVERTVRDHVTGRANHTLEIHKLLTLELVHRLFVDHQPARRALPAVRCTVTAA